MAELRKCPLTGQWRLIGGTPTSSFANSPDVCPFCPGNEQLSGPEIFAFRDRHGPDGPGWTVRTVPNAKPILRVKPLTRSAEGIYDLMNDKGADEIIIEAPEHGKRFVDLPTPQIQDILWMYRHRILNLKEDPAIRQVLVFRDQQDPHRRHPHSQVLATPFMSARMMRELNEARHHYQWKERCVLCDIIAQELLLGERVVKVTNSFVALVPFAPRFCNELWILPQQHHAFFEHHLSPPLAHELAELLKELLGAYERTYSGAEWSYTLHTGPNTGSGKVKKGQWKTLDEDFHWHIEIVPHSPLTRFEKRSGIYSTIEVPEKVAAALRQEIEECNAEAAA
ncbi:MAG: galactose-1-phosphate uridylyltransferase [Pseudomonadota bacterium]